MSKLIFKDKEILSNLRYLTGTFKISKGLMFASKKRCSQGVCLVLPTTSDVKFGAAVTMFFCLHPLEILFVNTKNIVVDKVILKPWKGTYVPKNKCKYIIEAYPGIIGDKVKIGDKIKIEK